MKRLVTIVLLFLMILIVTPVYAQTDTTDLTKYFYDGQWHDYNVPITYLQVNGEKLETDVPPIIFNDRSVVPARAVFEKLGAEVSWDGGKSQVAVGLNNTDVLLTIDDKIAVVNGKKYEMDIPAKIINDRTMIPVRFVAETLGMVVEWEATQRLITINHTTNIGQVPAPDTGKNGISTDVKINKVDYSVNGSKTRITINADAAMGQYASFEMDDHPRLVIDINNAILDIQNKSVELNNNNVYKVRYSQYELSPNITRFVLDLKTWTSYNIELSDDKKQLFIDFSSELSNINDIRFVKNGSKNSVSIKMDSLQKPNIFRLSNPDRVIIDIPLSTLNAKEKVIEADETLVQAVRFAQFDANTVRVVVDVNGQPEFELKEESKELVLEFSKPTYKNLYYDSYEQPRLIIYDDKAASNYKEQAEGNNYTISVSSNINVGEGRLFINDSFLDFIDIVENDKTGMTDIVFHGKQAYGYTVKEQPEDDMTVITIGESTAGNKPDVPVNSINIEIRPEIKNKIVVIDPGHGGKDPGAVYGDLREKDPNLTISLYLLQMLKDAGIKTAITRTDDTFIELADRAALANNLNASLFISVHNNSITDPNYKGTMTLYYPSSSSYNSEYGITGKRLAQIAQEEMVKYLGTVDLGLRERPRLVVLNKTNMPAIIAEVAFLTNSSDRENLKDDTFLRKAAQALYVATIRALNESVGK